MTDVVRVLILDLVVGAVLYELGTLVNLTVPHRRHHVLGILVGVVGSVLGTALVLAIVDPESILGPSTVIGAAVGALGVIFVIVHLTTDTDVGLVINPTASTKRERQLAQQNEPPFVWPYELFVRKGGAVAWHVSEPGVEIEIEFLDERSPFEDEEGNPRLKFKGSSERPILAAPVVKSGSGTYKITATVLQTQQKTVADPPWKIPPY